MSDRMMGRRRGSCYASNEGRGGRASHGNNFSSSDGKKLCRFFAHDTCRYGSQCRFSHDVDITSNSKNTPLPHDDEYHEWKQLIRYQARLSSGPDLFNIWSAATAVLNSNNRERHQCLAQDLVDDKTAAPDFILRTLELRPGSPQASAINDFLSTITHPALIDCLTVDTYIGKLYNMVSGVDGRRAIPFFVELLQDFIKTKDSRSDPTGVRRHDDRTVTIMDALYYLFIREKTAAFHQETSTLLKTLDEVLIMLDTVCMAASLRCRASRDRLGVLHRIVHSSTGLLGDTDEISDNPKATQTPGLSYPLDLPRPGTRHDNDHTDIRDISVVPTAAELATDLPDYLPSTDWTQPHFLPDMVQRHLDTHFRLLRHDIFGDLKAAVSPLLQAEQSGLDMTKMPRDTSANVYHQAEISHILVHEKRGYEMRITFLQPPNIRRKEDQDRRQYWQSSKRLEPGCLVCLVSSDGDQPVPLLLVVTEKVTDSKGVSSADRSQRMNIIVRLAVFRDSDLEYSIGIYKERSKGLLIEPSGLLPATFIPILANLQKMMSAAELPFRTCILPDRDEQGQSANPRGSLSPPQYTRRPDFSFSLDTILLPDAEALELRSSASTDDQGLVERLAEGTGLDAGQSKALIYALTREFALIQGPPGTGKSYLGVKLLQVLVAAKDEGMQSRHHVPDLGPIIVICYTNHALDQFLLHLLNVGIRKIIRIGGQSRSAALDPFNLRNISANIPKTRHEGYLIGSSYSNLEDGLKRAGAKLGKVHKLRKGLPWGELEAFIEKQHPEIFLQIYRDQIEDWKAAGRASDPLQVWAGLDNWRTEAPGQPAGSIIEGQNVIQRAAANAESLSSAERHGLILHWTSQIQQSQVQGLSYHLERSEEARGQIDQVHSEVRRRTLLTADVIGITTTGLAKDITTIRNLRSKVVVFEEAAEVLEAHTLSALMPGVEHMIQIGDHQQLRPQINNFSLSLESTAGRTHQLDRSQFERLAIGQPGLAPLPVAQLDVQRRMRPTVSNLIRKTMYSALRDHNNVLKLPDVVGMRDNVFWLDHDHLEDSAADDGRVRSHSNAWEVEMIKGLVRHLIRQGAYKSTDLAVLTPYSGQLIKLRAALDNEFDISLSERDEETLAKEGFEAVDSIDKLSGPLQKKRLSESLRLATVDNFQGEEAKVIITTLVRSNLNRKVGFLKIKNRINVLLSRAQHGMYLIGNADTYSKIPMWDSVQQVLTEQDALGSAFRLCCPRHQETPIDCSEPGDFQKLSPQGGCTLPCEWRLERCGHQCLAQCHSEAMHSVFLCPRPCPKRWATCEHSCPKLCGEECGPCKTIVDGVKLPCGHTKDGIPCFRAQDPARLQCDAKIEAKVPICGHVVIVPCHKDVASPKFVCNAPCGQLFECGHACTCTCGECKSQKEAGTTITVHRPCKKTCDRPRNTCPHSCESPCHPDEPCPPCGKQCEVRCAHSRCPLPCREACPPCIERCAWACEHQAACTMPCAGPCNRLPCDMRCTRLLKCGHRCPGLCGEVCPQDHCHTCSDKGDARVDLLELNQFQEIDVDETPIVVLSCGHFFTAESLDGCIGLSTVYARNQQGEYIGLLEPSSVLPIPRCPDCQQPIRQFATQRYNRVINAAVMDETSKRFLLNAERQLADLETGIASASEAQAQVIRASSPDLKETKRKRNLKALVNKANKLYKATDESNQPSRKLFNATLQAKRQQAPLEDRLGSLGLQDRGFSQPERQAVLGSLLAVIKVDSLVFEESWYRPSQDDDEQRAREVKKSVESFFKKCESLISKALEENFPKLMVKGILECASFTVKYRTVPRVRSSEHTDMVKAYLAEAAAACEAPFSGAEELGRAVDSLTQHLKGEWYEEVSSDEMAAIKAAMVNGPAGIATHSGHWYRCANGHAFAIGECGMPMEEARCPECGARIGGQHHSLLDGNSRATEME